MANSERKRKLTFLTFNEKSIIVKAIEEGTSKDEIRKTYGISRATLYNILHEKGNIIALSQNEEYKKKKTKRSSEDVMLEECVFTWFCQARAAGNPISGPIIQAKALHFNNLLGGPSHFKASKGWLENFKNRHGIRQLTIRGEILSNDSEAAKIFQNEIVNKIEREELLLENVYNADESGLYWKAFPHVTLASQEEKSAPGRKECKNHITVLFCCNAAGTNKLRLCIIGQSAKPRSVRDVKTLPVVYKAQKKGWMTRDLFKEW